MEEERIWKIGMYIRLSRDDGSEESLSVSNQRKILLEFVEQSFRGAYSLEEIYIDDGQSGTDYDRPDFLRMVGDVEQGRIDCILCKTLSRAFRNYADQGYFLESFFPRHGVRFIALGDPPVDTFLHPEAVNGLEIPISGLMNDRFACRTSCDIRRTFDTKRRKGEFIGAFAPYGYRKDPQNKNHLLVDPEAAQVVKDIFRWFAYGDAEEGAAAGGVSKAGIARKLNEAGIPNPSAYKRKAGLRYQNPQTEENDGLWQGSSVAAILSNEVYTGTMVQGRQRVISYKVHDRVEVPEASWYRVPHAHEPIIEQELFALVQELQAEDRRRAPGERKNHRFSGLLKCADCHKAMTRKPSRGIVYFNCSTYKRKSRERCTSHTIRLDVLEEAVLAAVQREIETAACGARLVQELAQVPRKRTAKERRGQLLKRHLCALERTRELEAGLYADWKNGDLTRSQYHEMKKRFAKEAGRLQEYIRQLRAESAAREAEEEQSEDALLPLLEELKKDKTIHSLPQELLARLVKEIQVQERRGREKGELTIWFRFSAPLMEAHVGHMAPGQQEPPALLG